MRGRNNNRKGPNPLTRSYESNGPDVKVRGTAQHVAEKYIQLARDAQSSGDPVMAENYLQHAEHYYRLIAAAIAAQQPQGQPRPFDDAGNDVDDGDDGEEENDRFAFNPPPQQQNRPQHQQQPGFGGDDQPGTGPQPFLGEGGGEGGGRGEQRFGDRGPRRERFNNDRPRFNNDRNDRRDRFQRDDRPQQPSEAAGGERADTQDRGGERFGGRRDRFPPRGPRPEAGGDAEQGLPAFLTNPVRANPVVEAPAAAPAPAPEAGGDAPAPKRRGRPRKVVEDTPAAE